MTTEPKSAETTPSPEDLEQWLRTQIAAELQVAPESIRADQSMLSYGVDSMQAIAVIAKLEDRLNFRYAVNPLEEFATIAELAEDAAARGVAASRDRSNDDSTSRPTGAP